jgi:hypothetical protein
MIPRPTAFCLAAFSGLVFSLGAHGQEKVSAPVEICEAFPWDIPVEKSFTVASVLRWRHAMDSARIAAKKRPMERTAR